MADEVSPEVQAERDETLRSMGAPQSAITGTEAVFTDYFGTDQTWKVMFPDGKQYVEHKLLNEGDRKSFLDKTNHDIKFNRNTGETALKSSPGSDQHELLRAAVCGWNLYRHGEALTYSAANRDKFFLKEFPPHLIDLVAKDVRAKNPWMTQDISIEDIDKELKYLNDLRDRKEKEEEGKDASTS